MALTVQTNTKKYCSYLYNNIDFSNKWFNFIMFYIYLFMFCFAILYFLMHIAWPCKRQANYKCHPKLMYIAWLCTRD